MSRYSSFHKSPRRDAGFTLLEVLIATFIFSLISVGAMLSLTTTLRGKAQLDERLANIQALDMSRSILRSDMTNLILRPQRDQLGAVEPYLIEGGVTSLLTFTRQGKPNPGGLERRGGLERVAYIFQDGTIVRRSSTRINPTQGSAFIEQILYENVTAARTEFRTNTIRQGQLFLAPEQSNELPDIISIYLMFATGQELVQHFEVRA